MDVFETFVKVKLDALAFLRPQRASHPPLHPAPAKLASTAANSKATGWAPHVLAFGPAVSHEYAFALYLRISVRRCLHRFPCPVHWSLRVLSCILDPYLYILFTLSQNHGDEAGARRGDVARAKDAVESTKSIEAVSHEITNLRGKNAITTLPVDLMTDVMQILQRWVSARIRTMGGGGGGRKGRGHNGENAWGCGTSHP